MDPRKPSSSSNQSQMQSKLIAAAKAGDLLEVQRLTQDNEINLDCRDSDGKTPLMHAAWRGHLAVVGYLVGKGATVNIRAYDKKTPLLCAASYGFSEVVRSLLAHQADVTWVSNSGKSALIYSASMESIQDTATANRYYHSARQLIEYKSDLNWQDDAGETALMMAAKASEECGAEMFDLLLGSQADIELKDKEEERFF